MTWWDIIVFYTIPFCFVTFMVTAMPIDTWQLWVGIISKFGITWTKICLQSVKIGRASHKAWWCRIDIIWYFCVCFIVVVKRLLPSSLLYKPHFSRQLNCWSLRCSWCIACRRCSNCIFVLNLTPGFNGLDKYNYKMRREAFKFWDLVRVILETLRYIYQGNLIVTFATVWLTGIPWTIPWIPSPLGRPMREL